MKKAVLLAAIALWTALAVGIGAILFWGIYYDRGWEFMKGFGFMQDTLLKEETFDIADLGGLTFDTSYQSIRITLVDGGGMTVRQYGREGEDELFTSSREGASLTISIPQRNIISFGFFMASPRLEIELPRSYAADLYAHASSGSVTIEGRPVWGRSSVVTSSGGIRLENGLTSGDLRLSSSSGSIRLGDTTAASLDAKSTSGSIHLGDITVAGAASASSTSGSLHCDRLRAGGSVALDTTSGGIRFGDIDCAAVSGKSSSGGISTGAVHASGQARFSASSGSVRLGTLVCGSFVLETSSGGLSADSITGMGTLGTTSGSINVGTFAMTGNSSARTSSGSIKLGMARDQNAELKLRSSSGSIRADRATLVYHNNRGNDASGTLGDGSGGLLTAETSSGSIRID